MSNATNLELLALMPVMIWTPREDLEQDRLGRYADIRWIFPLNRLCLRWLASRDSR